jgi:hypothetical protein
MVLPREKLSRKDMEKLLETVLSKYNTSWLKIWDMIQTTQHNFGASSEGIKMTYAINMNYVIIEGDSKIIISLESKIINGNDPVKITPIWCLMGPLKTLQALL